MPPNRKTSKRALSSGLMSFSARGSRRQTLFRSPPVVVVAAAGGEGGAAATTEGYSSSTPRVSARNAGSAVSFPGRPAASAGGRLDSTKAPPARPVSRAIATYSSSDHGPSSGSRCSTM
ncbi:putative DUF431 domain-containing protein [Rosellinia necatrix]|uniref:Putative DUF431 domain-containing protein n=1 Tax=Rosellinia necatrix TaxID=77044 RepID=A0A1S8A955_ROSNE|nr:putative DUF431 domain-containing protein [Rosellinia necatrix]